MKTRKPVAVVVVAALVVTGCTTTVRRHPSFGERRAKIASVAVVPADVAFVRMVFRGDNQPLPEETGRVRGRLPALVTTQLQKRGFTVKEARLELGLTQAQLGRALGRTQPWVREVESGRTAAQPYVLAALAEEAGRSVGWFFGEPDRAR